MKITKILSQHRNDFTAMVACEHCGHTAKLTNGYDDDHYHTRVMPVMICSGCGKNRAGETTHSDSEVTPCRA